jgi:uncharacterized protein (TIGR02145 family)
MKIILLSIIILIISIPAFSQGTEKRVALVIGNYEYIHGGALTWPRQDAATMVSVLQELDFDVTYLNNATYLNMRNAFLDFIRKVETSNISLIYYSGHGIQIDGINYLVPVDANIIDKPSAKEMSININNWVSQLEVNEKNLNIVILDACRKNPYKAWTKGSENGLTSISAPTGTIIAFATRSDDVAQDNGLYAKTLAAEMRKPQRIEDVFNNTRVVINKATNGQQCPMEWNQITGKYYLKVSDIDITEDFLTGSVNIITENTDTLVIDGMNKGEKEANKVYTVSNLSIGTHTIQLGNQTQRINIEYGTTKDIVFKKQIIEKTNNSSVLDNSKQGSIFWEDEKFGHFIDNRDDHQYKVVEIGAQIWMAENLAYKSSNGCWAYENKKSNVKNYGYLYDWETARNACPSGWHLPSTDEWTTLINYFGGDSIAGLHLSATNPIGWDLPDERITNKSGFTALPGGARNREGSFVTITFVACWWSSTDISSSAAVYRFISWGLVEWISTIEGDVNCGFSVRCILDQETK